MIAAGFWSLLSPAICMAEQGPVLAGTGHNRFSGRRLFPVGGGQNFAPPSPTSPLHAHELA